MIKVKSGIGLVETAFTLENGWNLTQFGETRDAKTPEMIDALTGTLKGVSGILETKAMRKEEFLPGLYIFISYARKPQAFKPGDEWHPFGAKRRPFPACLVWPKVMTGMPEA